MRRIIQVGVGGMGLVWTDRVAESEKWEAAAYVDINRRNLMTAAARHRMPKTCCYTNLERALNEVEADALLDVTPQQFRKEVCLAALERGLHVLAEKPLADSLPNGRALVDRAARLRRVLMVAQNYRYQPGAQTFKRFIQRGQLGEPGYVGISFHKGPRFTGYRTEMAYPLVLDMSIHHFDLLRFFFDTDIKEVEASSISAPWNWNKGDATVMAQLRLANGVVANYFASWVSRGWDTTWNGSWRVEGRHGVLLWENGDVLFSDKPSHRRKIKPVKFPLTHQAYLLEAFAKALDTGREPETSGRRNLNSLGATHAVIQAAEAKHRVKVGELLK